MKTKKINTRVEVVKLSIKFDYINPNKPKVDAHLTHRVSREDAIKLIEEYLDHLKSPKADA